MIWKAVMYVFFSMYPVLLQLQQHIFLAFCNNFDKHYCMFADIPLRNKILLFPKWREKPTLRILRYSLVFIPCSGYQVKGKI